ncbi:MFS transporter [Marinitenerispora sediminis]|uniref:MFS transporter n=1 Tax=Marinitenerispora sediminis TaxID=1931232 RepID=A0A368T1B7_9ACTN|nr:MFS transporter [Marinitenerispora sediminis]RCV53782.1 MFS transporter [Marinitenerispora sediminis]RCV59618.1 MFS transporter [Marinitenerispora sediminis]
MSDSPDAPPASEPAVRRREQRAWYVYDWANSVFSTSVITVFLGPYLTSVAERAARESGTGELDVLGWAMRPEALYPYATSLSVLLQLVLLPAIGAIADHTGRKRALMGAFAYVGAFATMGLYFVQGTGYLLGAALFVLANLAFGASVVVYNAFLPEISTPRERDGVSARGWAAGYLGGALLLAVHLALYLSHESFGLAEDHAVRISMASAGVWWALFALVPLARLRDRRRPPAAGPGRPGVPGTRVALASFGQLWSTLRGLRRYPRTLLFLLAYVAFNDGVQTVIAFAATFADQALGLGQEVQIGAILMVQFVAFGGALLLGALARRFGTKRTILASLVVWALVVGAAPLLQTGAAGQFFALAFCIAIVLGGTQALSRSLFSQLIPRGREAEYFGLYEISDKGSAFLGALTIGIALDATGGDYRLAILSLIAFFVVGFAVLCAVNIPAAIRDAGNDVPERV